MWFRDALARDVQCNDGGVAEAAQRVEEQSRRTRETLEEANRRMAGPETAAAGALRLVRGGVADD